MPFHLQYRPKSFKRFLGNESTVQTLETLLKKDDPPRAYLFHGPKGCGKTSLARIMARELDCQGSDLVEINAASSRGIDTIRDINREMKFRPMIGASRVWILDEIQGTLKGTQQALLKPLEEPPEWVTFFLCTTDPGSLLPTVKDRCITLTVSPLESKDLHTLLCYVCRREKKLIPEPVENEIVRLAEGGPRRALVLLEAVIGLDKKDMARALKEVQDKERSVIELCRALLKAESWKNITPILKGIEEEPESIRRAVMGYMSSVVLNKKDVKDSTAQRAWEVYDIFQHNFYDTGKPGLVFACYEAVR